MEDDFDFDVDNDFDDLDCVDNADTDDDIDADLPLLFITGDTGGLHAKELSSSLERDLDLADSNDWY